MVTSRFLFLDCTSSAVAVVDAAVVAVVLVVVDVVMTRKTTVPRRVFSPRTMD